MKRFLTFVLLSISALGGVSHAGETMQFNSHSRDGNILHRLKYLEHEVEILRKEVIQLTATIDTKQFQSNRTPADNKWGCYLASFGNASVGVGATKAEATGNAIANCNKAGQSFCRANRVKCSSK